MVNSRMESRPARSELNERHSRSVEAVLPVSSAPVQPEDGQDPGSSTGDRLMPVLPDIPATERFLDWLWRCRPVAHDPQQAGDAGGAGSGGSSDAATASERAEDRPRRSPA